MKGDIGPKERENWNKIKSKGKKRYILSRLLAITAVIVFVYIIQYLLFQFFFKAPDFTPKELLINLITLTIITIIVNALIADEVWIRNSIKFEKENALEEIDDAQLKDFISKREKLKAAKRYREIT